MAEPPTHTHTQLNPPPHDIVTWWYHVITWRWGALGLYANEAYLSSTLLFPTIDACYVKGFHGEIQMYKWTFSLLNVCRSDCTWLCRFKAVLRTVSRSFTVSVVRFFCCLLLFFNCIEIPSDLFMSQNFLPLTSSLAENTENLLFGISDGKNISGYFGVLREVRWCVPPTTFRSSHCVNVSCAYF